MSASSFRFDSNSDRLSIQAFLWEAESPRFVVVISHGAAEHALRYERFALALNAVGITVWAMDHRGHGRSPGPQGQGDMGEGGWNALVNDMGQLVEMARKAHPDLPLILFGHSMGSFAAQQYIMDRSHLIDGLILSGSTAWKPPQPGEKSAAAVDLNQGFEGRTNYDWLSRDPAEVDKYIADPLCGFEGMEAGRVQKIFSAIRRYQDAETFKNMRKDLPCLLVAGEADPVNNHMEGLNYLEELWRKAGIERIDKQYYKGGRHEMLNEINRDEVARNIIHWVVSLKKNTPFKSEKEASRNL